MITDLISLTEELYRGTEIVTVSTMQSSGRTQPRIKSLNYLNNILAKIEGLRPAAQALMLNHKGEVAECTGDNIFLVRRQAAHPPIDACILEGVTATRSWKLARAGIEVRDPLTKHDVVHRRRVFRRARRPRWCRWSGGQPHDRRRRPARSRDLAARFTRLTASTSIDRSTDRQIDGSTGRGCLVFVVRK